MKHRPYSSAPARPLLRATKRLHVENDPTAHKSVVVCLLAQTKKRLFTRAGKRPYCFPRNNRPTEIPLYTLDAGARVSPNCCTPLPFPENGRTKRSFLVSAVFAAQKKEESYSKS